MRRVHTEMLRLPGNTADLTHEQPILQLRWLTPVCCASVRTRSTRPSYSSLAR